MTSSNHYHQLPGFASNPSNRCFPPPAAPGQARIAYFITRGADGPPVPLIPADELPYTVKLQNVPRVLTRDQAYGLNHVGSCPFTGTIFKLEQDLTSDNMQRFDGQPYNDCFHGHNPIATMPRQYQAPDSLARQPFGLSHNQMAHGPIPGRPVSAHEASKSWRRPDSPAVSSSTESVDASQNVLNVLLRSQAGAATAERIGYHSPESMLPPSGQIPDPNRKIWCTHWILTGNCAFVQQGCRYKHEMPDKATLNSIGIRHVPRWYAERNAAVKLGGDRAALGPMAKPHMWLQARKGSDADSEGSSTDLSRDSETTDPSSQDGNVSPKVTVEPVGQTTVPTLGSSIAKAGSLETSGLLIDHPTLIRTPSASTPSSNVELLTPPTSDEEVAKESPLTLSASTSNVSAPATTKSDRAAKAINKDTSESPAQQPAPKTNKVFVPAGESPEVHIAANKRVASRNKRLRTSSPITTSTKTELELEKLIEEIRTTSNGVTGLSASMHAPIEKSRASVESSQVPVKRRTKTLCRERIPASSSPAGTADVIKK